MEDLNSSLFDKNSIDKALLRMQSSLACTICLDLISAPVTTKCGHTFCKACIERVLTEGRSPVSCPLCIAPISKRSYQANAHISVLVAAVRKVIHSIKEDCGICESTNGNNVAEFTVDPGGHENSVPLHTTDFGIKRATRNRTPVSYFSPPAKKNSHARLKKTNSTPGLMDALNTSSTCSFSGFGSVEGTSAPQTPTGRGDAEDAINKQVSNSGQKSIEKVEKWLNASISPTFPSPVKNNKNPSLTTNQISNTTLKNSNSTVNSEPVDRDSSKGMKNIASQSTVLFDYDDVIQSEAFLAESVAKSATLPEEKELVKDSAKEKENEGIPSITVNKNKIKKCILSELNNLNLVKNSVKQDVNSTPDEATIKDGGNLPNKKGHNIRFTSEVKTKFLEPAKHSKLKSSSKAKKSPGWSRIERARKDLKSKHTSLDIKAGVEKKSNVRLSDSTTSHFSQESVVLIEEDKSPLTECGDEIFKKPRALPAQKPSNSVDASKKLEKNVKVVLNRFSSNSKVTEPETVSNKVDNHTTAHKTLLNKSEIIGVNNYIINQNATTANTPQSMDTDEKSINSRACLRSSKRKVASNKNIYTVLSSTPKSDIQDAKKNNFRNIGTSTTVGLPRNLSRLEESTNSSAVACSNQSLSNVIPLHRDLIPKGKVDENDAAQTVNSIPHNNVGYEIKGNLNKRSANMPCFHSIPCELYSTLVKFASFLMANPCNHSSSDEAAFSDFDNARPRKKDVTDEELKDSCKVNSEVLCSDLDVYEKETALELPDEVYGVNFKIRDNFHDTYMDDGRSEMAEEIVGNKTPTKNLLPSVVVSSEIENTVNISKPNRNIVESTSTVPDSVKDSNSVCLGRKGKGRIFDVLDNGEEDQRLMKFGNTSPVKAPGNQETNSKDVEDNDSLCSPMKFKRPRRSNVLESSSSDSDDEVMNRINAKRPKKKKCSGSESSPAEKISKVGSEELRDFERYDENVWNYYKDKMVEAKSPRKEQANARISDTEVMSEEELIPGTEESFKIESTAQRIKKLSKPNIKSNVLNEAINACSQESIQSTSTLNSMSISTKNLFKQCNTSINKAKHILDVQQNLTLKNTRPGGLSDTKPSSVLKEADVKQPDCFSLDSSRMSVLSTQSNVISTQKRDCVQQEILDLKSKISMLEKEMAEKHPDVSKGRAVDIRLTDKRANGDFALSEADSEELFGSVASTARQQNAELKEGASQEQKPLSLICTGLGPVDVSLVEAFVDQLCCDQSKLEQKWSPATTHVVVRVNEEKMTERTLKYLFGVASGTWIVSLRWIEDSLKAGLVLPESDYEALDCTGAPGPTHSRLLPEPIFKECQFLLIPPFEDITVTQLTELIEICGGATVKFFDNKKSGFKLLVMNSPSSDKDIASIAGFKRRGKVTVSCDWLIECIGMCSLVSLSSYVIGHPTAKEFAASSIPQSLLYETQKF